MTNQFIAGFVRSPHGLSGEVKVESASGEYNHFERMTYLTLRQGEVEKRYEIEHISCGAATLYVKFAGIDTPEAARAIAGAQLIVPREDACPLQTGEYYIEDLKKCVLVAVDSGKEAAPLASVNDVIEGGGGYLLEVLPCTEASVSAIADPAVAYQAGRTVLVPFNEVFIGAVNVDTGCIELRREWILDDDN